MKFYTFYQNNSGGWIYENEDVEKLVVIEAEDGKKAWKRLWEIVDEGDYLDSCECCGLRWDDDFTDEGDEPLIFGDPIREQSYGCIIYYADGRKERIIETD